MALDKENRPRGLRVPSLSAFKSHRKPVDNDTTPLPVPTAAATAVAASPPAAAPAPVPVAPPPQYPIRTDSAPIRPPRLHHEKELPPNPLSSLPTAATVPLAPEDIHPAFRNEIIAAQNYQHVTIPNTDNIPAGVSSQVQVQRPPSSDYSIPPDAEDFIPDPDGVESADENNDNDNGPFTPPEIEPVAVPLNRLHFACFQDHRSMMPANNVWYSLPCMACQKFDREVRYRCVFCCLRICASCHVGLQRCSNRSLAQLMETLLVEA